MKLPVILIMGILVASVFGVFNYDDAFAQSLVLPEITKLSSQKTSYTYGDKIEISGNTKNYLPYDVAHMKVILPNGDALLESNLAINDDGNFSYTMTAGGLGWTEEGKYSINVFVADEQFDNNTFFEYTNLIQSKNKLETIFGQLDAQTQSDVQSFDVKISREQSQYDEYYKQYEYYESQLSTEEDPKFAPMISKLNSLDEKINSLIDDRNMLVFLNEFTPEFVEEDAESNLINQFEKQSEKELFCFLFWCW